MPTQLLIKRGSTALSDTRVEIDEAIEARTDANGLIHLDLEPGPHQLRIQVDGNRVQVPFRLESGGELHVLDIDELLEDAMRETAGLPDDVPVEVAERYRVQEVLGRGGMGIVVRAWDTLLERQVAIKFLNDKMAAHDEAQDIFLKEARSLARLRHDALVDVHDVSVDDGQPIMVTEFVEGDNLAAVLSEQGQLESDQVLRLAESVCEGLTHMHRHGLIHRDIKPANIILQPDGHLKLIDFGLARSLEHLVSQGTQIRGTPAYMAPEQVKGEDLSPATDVYQLGVTLFELVTGTIPFPDDPHGLAHVQQSVPSLTSRGIDPDPTLEALIDACLRKDPDERPADASVILDHLRSVPEKQPAPATPTNADHRRTFPPWAITATSTVAVIGLAALAWLYVGSTNDDAGETESIRDAAPPIRPTDPSPTAAPAIGGAIDGASSEVSDAHAAAARSVKANDTGDGDRPEQDESADPEVSSPSQSTSDQPSRQPEAAAQGDAPSRSDAGSVGSAQRRQGSGPGREDGPTAPDTKGTSVPDRTDIGVVDSQPSETNSDSAASATVESDGSRDNSATPDAGSPPAPEESPQRSEPPSDGESSDDSPDSSKDDPPNPRFF